jgi:hypothetical protein
MAGGAMSALTPSVRFEYEWEPAVDVRSAELASTWARFEMWVGDRCVTQVEDAASGSGRRSIYCSLYPLAEWIAFNWWALEAYVRPSALEPEAWSYRRLVGRHSNDSRWLRQHNIRAAGDGFLWPNLSIIPEGEVSDRSCCAPWGTTVLEPKLAQLVQRRIPSARA